MCMKGGIYSDEMCPVCGGRFRHYEPRGMSCPLHPKCRPTSFKVIFGNVTKRFRSYDDALRFLTGVRYETDKGKFDERDYRKDRPLGFANLAERWLEIKRVTVKPKSYNNLRNYMNRAISAWGNTSVKEIGYAEIEDFLLNQAKEGKTSVSGKTKANMRSALHDFWHWLRRRRILDLSEVPDFPEISYRLGIRKLVSKDVQEKILAEIKRISWATNPRIWIGIKWLSTYVALRPNELRNIKEEHINLDDGCVLIPNPKEGKAKTIPLLPQDVELVRSLPRGLPHLYFFRHLKGNGPAQPGGQFGDKYLYKWWKRACANLGIEGVDLYGGTRHSSATALRKYRTPEEIKRATMHSTNKAFERYFQTELDDIRQIYADVWADKEMTRKSCQSEKAKVLKFFNCLGGGGGSRIRQYAMITSDKK